MIRLFFYHQFKGLWKHARRIGACYVLLLCLTMLVNADKGETMAHTSYTVAAKTVEGFQVYYIQQDNKAVAQIVPALGNNCCAFKVADGETWLNLIDAPPDLATLEERPTAYGNPILFPFPNRIRNGTWQFEGETYQFDKSPESPTTIHGLLLNQPYQVESHTADENGATLVCSLNSQDFPEVVRQYPFPFKIEITYTLKDTVLTMETSIKNIGDRNMPMGFGIHPYFSVDLGTEADASQAVITVPAAEYWELDEVLVPTGRRHTVSGTLDLQNGQPFSRLKLDHVFTDVQFVDGVSRCLIGNKDTGYGMVMESDAQFRELVVYTPPNRNAICFEPYTCPTDAINLEARGIPAGVIVLAPDETFSGTVRFLLQ
ncbi:MAG: aldose 1-epimerase [Candidatus Poribacteria bacterium]|nr:aldose 1-epimerase [Candidatus Poribacteria bacterium]